MLNICNSFADLLKKSTPSRIVIVSSIAHKFTTFLDLDNLSSEKYYSAPYIYFNSKLATILFARELSKKLDGTGRLKDKGYHWLLLEGLLVYTCIYVHI